MSISSIHKALNEDLRITLKLARCEVEKINALETIRMRKHYAVNFLRNRPSSSKKWIFIDESGFNLHLRRSFARSRVNERAIITVPTQKGRNITLIAAMSNRGVVHTHIISKSTCNSEKFCTFLKTLVNELDEAGNMDGSWLIMDNAAIHKTQMVRDIVQGKPYQLMFLPPYSPMLNPIENMFSKIKTLVRELLADPSQNTNLIDCIKESTNKITKDDCTKYVKHMLENIEKAKNDQFIN